MFRCESLHLNSERHSQVTWQREVFTTPRTYNEWDEVFSSIDINCIDATSSCRSRDLIQPIKQKEQLVLFYPCTTKLTRDSIDQLQLFCEPVLQRHFLLSPAGKIENNRDGKCRIVLGTSDQFTC